MFYKKINTSQNTKADKLVSILFMFFSLKRVLKQDYISVVLT